MAMKNSTKKGSLSIAASIIVAGIIIAVSLMLVGRNSGGNVTASGYQGGTNTASAGDFRLVSEKDHLRGNPDAELTIIEFSDFECPFCARLHPTLKQIIAERNDINWVYRHFPLSSIHSRALTAAVASECVAKLGGNDAFWAFSDILFNNQRDLGDALYERSAQSLGISLNEFSACMNDKEITQIVRDDLSEAVNSGGRGTPFSILVTKDNRLVPFTGALPYENLIALIEQNI